MNLRQDAASAIGFSFGKFRRKKGWNSATIFMRMLMFITSIEVCPNNETFKTGYELP